MPIVRGNDPKSDDIKHQILVCLGKLLDSTLSVETQKNLMNRLTELLKGKGYDQKSFSDLGMTSKVSFSGNGDRNLSIYVPKNYVSSNIVEDRDNQWIVFTISKATNVENLKGDVAYYEDGKTVASAQ